jgi:ABC-type iron transport system FetAB ATPase subunit
LHSHETSDKDRFAISYLSDKDLPKPEALKSEFIIGWTPEQDKVDPRTFIENTKFVDFMTSVLKKNVHKVNDSNLKAMADWQKEGYVLFELE